MAGVTDSTREEEVRRLEKDDWLKEYEKSVRERLGWMLGDHIQIRVALFEGIRPCAVCGELCEGSEGDYWICGRCGWEQDSVQEGDPDYRGGANDVSVNDAKENYARTGMAEPLTQPERFRQLIEEGLIEPIYLGFCSVCGHPLPGYLNMGETCPHCSWVDLPWYDKAPDSHKGWRNARLTLNQARENLRLYGRWEGPEGQDDAAAG